MIHWEFDVGLCSLFSSPYLDVLPLRMMKYCISHRRLITEPHLNLALKFGEPPYSLSQASSSRCCIVTPPLRFTNAVTSSVVHILYDFSDAEVTTGALVFRRRSSVSLTLSTYFHVNSHLPSSSGCCPVLKVLGFNALHFDGKCRDSDYKRFQLRFNNSSLSSKVL